MEKPFAVKIVYPENNEEYVLAAHSYAEKAEWVEALGTDAPHLFDANAGGGAVGSGAGGSQRGGGQVNPWSKATLNLTEQAKIMKSNPGLAARLEASAIK